MESVDHTGRSVLDGLIREVADGVSAAIGEQFFRILTRRLAAAMDADYALVGELRGGDQDRVRTLAVHALGRAADNFTYELCGTPCDEVLRRGVCSYSDQVQARFPDDGLLQEMGVEAYVGMPLRAARGDVVGLVAVMFRRPLERVEQSEALLRIFATRAAAEIERLRAERLLRESEERYRRLLQTLPHGIQVIDTRGIILYANPAHYRMYGYPEGCLEGRSMLDFLVDDASRETLAEYIAQLVVEQPEPTPWFGRNRTGDGREIDVRVDWDYRRGSAGEVVGFVSVLTDVTAQMEAQAEAQRGLESQRGLNDLLQLSLANQPLAEVLDRFLRAVTALPWLELEARGAVFLTAAGGEQLVLASQLNLKAESVARCARVRTGECLCGQAAELRQVVFRCAEGHPPVSGGIGPSDHGHYCAPLLAANGQPLGVLTLFTGPHSQRVDATAEFLAAAAHILSGVVERKRGEEQRARLEEQLLQSQKMEAVGVLASGIAHDFNNLLQAISGFTQLLLEEAEADGPQASHLTQIDRSVERAAGLVRDLLTFSRREPTEQRVLDLNGEVRQAMRILERTLPRMVRIESRLTERLPPVLGDATQLEQVVLNLGTNARDAMPDGGELVVRTDVVELDAEYCVASDGLQPGSYLRLEVRDSGCGMDADTALRVFEPFFTTKGVGQGTGLGLSTVYGIVRAHGGEIRCVSELGAGTCFVVHLPALPVGEELQAEDPAPVLPDVGGNELVLVVDDETEIARLASLALSAKGYSVLTAGSGEEALGHYIQDRERIALVILDLGMPGMGGRRCLAELLKLNAGLKVLVASGYSAGDQVREILDSGAVGFVAKPYRLAELTRAVRSALDA